MLLGSIQHHEIQNIRDLFLSYKTGPLDRMGSVKGGPYSDGCHTYLYERNHHQYSVINFQLENRDEPLCLPIRSYDQSNLIFTKILCGPDIFGSSRNTEEDFENKTIGSCKAMSFSSTNTIFAYYCRMFVVGCICIELFCLLGMLRFIWYSDVDSYIPFGYICDWRYHSRSLGHRSI